jgi:uncharacterized protein (DUF1501 family)
MKVASVLKGVSMQSRRVFLKNGALALVSLGFVPSFMTRTALAAGGRRRVLVAVFQRGAVDGLNMIVPYGESPYYRLRPTIAVQRPGAADGAIDLDGFFGLHPRMAPLKSWFDRRALAVVHATGSPDTTRSHFDAQDYMESATPGVKSTRDGWLNRYLTLRRDASETSPFRGVALVNQLPRSLQGTAAALAVSRLDQFDVRGRPSTRDSFETQYAEAADRLLGRTGREAFDALATIQRLDPARYIPESTARYPRSAFGDALRQIAMLIKADVGLEIAFAETGQWDHHVNEGGATGQLATRLSDLAGGLSALATDLGQRLSDVVILTMSEFGRTVAENGNRGTDHGHGNAMLVLGGPVQGGRVLGRWPGLAEDQQFEGRDLAVTTDFRDVFAEVVVRHLGVTEPTPIFPGYPVSASRFAGVIARG